MASPTSSATAPRCRVIEGRGTCTNTYKGGDKNSMTWEEGSHLKDYTYTITGGTGKYEGATGGGTYIYENLTDTLSGGTLQGNDTAALTSIRRQGWLSSRPPLL